MGEFYHLAWQPAVLGVALIATMAWVALLGYELFKIGELAFS